MTVLPSTLNLRFIDLRYSSYFSNLELEIFLAPLSIS